MATNIDRQCHPFQHTRRYSQQTLSRELTSRGLDNFEFANLDELFLPGEHLYLTRSGMFRRRGGENVLHIWVRKILPTLALGTILRVNLTT